MKDHDHEWEAITDPSYLGVGAVTGYRCTKCELVSPFKPGSRTVYMGATELTGVHPLSECEGKVCVIDNPSNHHMRYWPLVWDAIHGWFARRCDHYKWHPDPDDLKAHHPHDCCAVQCCIWKEN